MGRRVRRLAERLPVLTEPHPPGRGFLHGAISRPVFRSEQSPHSHRLLFSPRQSVGPTPRRNPRRAPSCVTGGRRETARRGLRVWLVPDSASRCSFRGPIMPALRLDSQGLAPRPGLAYTLGHGQETQARRRGAGSDEDVGAQGRQAGREGALEGRVRRGALGDRQEGGGGEVADPQVDQRRATVSWRELLPGLVKWALRVALGTLTPGAMLYKYGTGFIFQTHQVPGWLILFATSLVGLGLYGSGAWVVAKLRERARPPGVPRRTLL